MTDETNVDPAGAGGVANPPASSGAVDGNAELLSKLVEAIDERLKPIKGEIGGLYSRQDKDRNAFREFMDEYNKQKGKGLNDNEAYNAAESALTEREKQAKKDQMIEEIYQKFVGSSSPPTPGTGAGGAVDAAKVFEEYKLDLKDPQVALALGNRYESVEQAELAAARLIKAKQTAPSPNAAQQPADTSGVPKPQDATGLRAEYIQKVTAARGNKSIIKALQAQYKERGVDVGNIDFRV